MPELSRCAPHTITCKPWSLAECCERFAAAGCGGVSVWRDKIEEVGLDEATRIVRGSGLKVPALVRGGFFHEPDAIDVNKACIDEAAAIGAEMVVLVVGADPGKPLADQRKLVADGVAAVAPHASQSGVKLAIEPLHPMYADTRSCVNRMKEATDIAETLGDPGVGAALDVYHVWWDPDLADEIERCGKLGRLFAVHECDWRVPTRDFLFDRGVVGEGCIDVAGIRSMCEAAGFDGLFELEVFSNEGWAGDQDAWLARNLSGFERHG
ncbi:MAG: sugar phosphate isomerase/epimerase family protein [Planctomycetota bacterium]